MIEAACALKLPGADKLRLLSSYLESLEILDDLAAAHEKTMVSEAAFPTVQAVNEWKNAHQERCEMIGALRLSLRREWATLKAAKAAKEVA